MFVLPVVDMFLQSLCFQNPENPEKSTYTTIYITHANMSKFV
jgi:hypothetical protein